MIWHYIFVCNNGQIEKTKNNEKDFNSNSITIVMLLQQ